MTGRDLLTMSDSGDLVLDEYACIAYLQSQDIFKNDRRGTVTRFRNLMYNIGYFSTWHNGISALPAQTFLEEDERSFKRYRGAGAQGIKCMRLLQERVRECLTEHKLRSMNNHSDPVSVHAEFAEYLKQDSSVKDLRKSIAETYRSMTLKDPSEEYVMSTMLTLWLNARNQSQSSPL